MDSGGDVSSRRNNDGNRGDTLSEIEWDVDGESVFEGLVGLILTSEDLMIIYVDDGVDCETFELTYTNETGAQGYDADTMDDSDGDGDHTKRQRLPVLHEGRLRYR